MMELSLLPPNASQLERDLAFSTQGEDAWALMADHINAVETTLPDSFLPWYVAEWFLTDVVDYFNDYRALINAGLPWLRQRGTARSVELALSWIQLSVILEEDRTFLQINPGTIKAIQMLSDIMHLVFKSIPAHVHFYRMYHGYDVRPIVLSKEWTLDNGMLSDDSGVVINGVKLSFGQKHMASISTDVNLCGNKAEVRAAQIYYEDTFRLDYSCLGTSSVPNYACMISQLITRYIRGVCNPDSISHHYSVAYADIALSDGEPIGSINARFIAPDDIVIDDLITLSGQMYLSGDVSGLRHVSRNLMRESTIRLSVQIPQLTQISTTSNYATFCRGVHRHQQNNWSGLWDQRIWNPDYFSLKTWSLT